VAQAELQDDIYNEIDLEDLRGPAVDTTIRLDVQDKEDETNGDANNPTNRGIISGKTAEVSTPLLVLNCIELTEQELIEMTKSQLTSTQSLQLDFASVSVPNPLALRDQPKDAPPTPEEQVALDKFHYQRDSGILAMGIVKDLHLASNAENLELGE